MAGIWKKIPRTFQACIIASLCLVIAAGIVSGIVAGGAFALQTIILGGFSFALLCAYVVWTACETLRVKMQVEGKGDTEQLASAAALRIQVASLVKLLVLAAFLVTMVLVFGFDPKAALIGVSVIYIPLYIVPLFVKPAQDGPSDGAGSQDGEHEVEET